MEFPIEIQMLINAYAKPMTRPDWRKGSFINITYRSYQGQLGRLIIKEFKQYIDTCNGIIGNDPMFQDTFKLWADNYEKRNMDDIDIYQFRLEEYQID